MSISLTETGLKSVDSVIDASFKYINLIRNRNVSYEVYKEIQNISKIQFKFLEKNEKYGDYLASLANSMHDYSYKEILYGEFLHSVYNETLINGFLEQLNPENSLIILGSNEKLPDQKIMDTFLKNSTLCIEKWYQTKYFNSSLDVNYINELKKNNYEKYNFIIRPSNEYITKHNNIVSCYDDKVNNKFLFYIFIIE